MTSATAKVASRQAVFVRIRLHGGVGRVNPTVMVGKLRRDGGTKRDRIAVDDHGQPNGTRLGRR